MQRAGCTKTASAIRLASRIGSSGVVGIRSIKQMIPTIQIDEARFTEIAELGDREIGDGVRLAQVCILEEAIGAVFGSITLWYLVSTIAALV
jgi:hypothetical protein